VVNILSTGLLVALIAIAATALALSLEDNAEPPYRAAILTADRQEFRREFVPVPCPVTTPQPASDGTSIDPGILAPTPVTPFTSRMPMGSTQSCITSLPMGR
jgi:hypothetical protein